MLQQATGLRLAANQAKDINGLVDELCASGDIANPEELFTRLSNEPTSHPLWQRLTQLVTIGETYFFRNMAQFDALRTQVLPSLIAERRHLGSKQLRLWSAACATGEEPYSLAILLRE